MRRYRTHEVAAFVLLLAFTGCRDNTVATAPAPAAPSPVVQTVATPGQTEIIISQGEEVGHVAAKNDTLIFESLDNSNFSLSFSSDANKPPACDKAVPGTTVQVCGSYSCPLNTIALTHRVFYMIGPYTGAACPIIPAPTVDKKHKVPIPYSVVHCRNC
jgi:hypothetical protein